MQRHHKMWPRRAYRNNAVAWKFRNLACNVVLLTAQEHREIHAKYRQTPGGMPEREVMLRQIDKCKDCKGGCSG